MTIRDHVLYVPGWGWMCWTGQRWQEARYTTVAASHVASFYARRFASAASATSNPAERFRLLRAAKRVQNLRTARAMLRDLRDYLLTLPSELDNNAYLLNMANGTLDLLTNTLLPHDPQNLITRLIRIEYDPEAQAPTWEAFLHDALPDRDTVAFVQRAVGYSITGATCDARIFICRSRDYATKTAFLTTLRDTLYDYTRSPSLSVLLALRNDGSIDPSTASFLTGTRLAVAVGTWGTQKLNETAMARLTGDEPLEARRFRQKPFQFRPALKLWIAGDPLLSIASEELHQRIRVIPFRSTYSDEQRYWKMVDRLREEAPGILRWAIDGARMWLEQGLGSCPAVEEATEQLRRRTRRKPL